MAGGNQDFIFYLLTPFLYCLVVELGLVRTEWCFFINRITEAESKKQVKTIQTNCIFELLYQLFLPLFFLAVPF